MSAILSVLQSRQSEVECLLYDCYNKLCWRPPQYAPAPCKLTFDLLTLKVVSESRVTWATFVNFSLPMPLSSGLRSDVRARQTDVRRASSLNAPTLEAGA